ncbi:MAG: PP2C family protein-serine/threonine phosphatase [Anaerostipes sp.]|uniref:PP2C family protein-serine/threonine phosphatase n=1 Tax=Anaerostipes sp. TaxID=1872530 RepID=UPI00399A2355
MKKIVGHAVSNRGRVRENNEDNYLLGNCLNAESLDESETHFTQRAGLWTCAGVFDGMGGEAGGEIASNIASRVFQENTMNFDSFDREKISRHIEKTFAIANQAVVEERKKHSTCGTTGTVLITDGTSFKIFHRGDSRVYVMRDRKLYVLSKDHTLAQLKLDMGIYHSAEEIPERENHQLTEFIGMDYAGQAVPFESEWIEWKENDRILLCSDGLYDMCTSEMILKCLTMSGDVEKATHELFEMSMSFGGKDNITVIVLQLTDKKIA